jgi:hypothetical protein
MSNDAKLGLVVGIALVILIALVFFRKDAAGPAAQEANAPAQAQSSRAPAMRHSGNPLLLPQASCVVDSNQTPPAEWSGESPPARP